MQKMPCATQPLVSIGMPVFNGDGTIVPALESILQQTFTDFELIISDNASTDQTESICRGFLERDSRIRYIRQPHNIGATANFAFVLDHARGQYFHWAACDDIRSLDFLEANANFLKQHPDYVASTSPNRFENSNPMGPSTDFSLDAPTNIERIQHFFKHCWQSHGIFYSVMRTDLLRQCEIVGQSFIGADWAINLFLANHGKIHRNKEGMIILGCNGISNSPDALRAFRNQTIEFFLPLYRVSRYALTLSSAFPKMDRIRLIGTLLRINLQLLYHQTLTICCQWYYRNLKDN